MSILDRFSLAGLSAVVTGAGSGIGAAGAVALAEAGADLALVGRTRARLEETARAVEAAGRRALVVEADVTDDGSVAACAAAVQAAFGKADILFNNAGITSPKLLVDLEPAEWHQVIETNLTGAYLCSRAFAPLMMARKSGRIINMGSVLSARGMANRSVYSATKAGLANLGASLAFELGPYGITVNTIGATVIVTDLNRELVRTQPGLYAKVVERIALGRLSEVEDVTGALVFLASPAGAFVTGQTLYVDGGYTAG